MTEESMSVNREAWLDAAALLVAILDDNRDNFVELAAPYKEAERLAQLAIALAGQLTLMAEGLPNNPEMSLNDLVRRLPLILKNVEAAMEAESGQGDT